MNKQKLPVGWKEVELPEIVWFQEGPGVRKHQFTTKGIKLINGRNIVNNKLTPNNTETHISEEEATTKYKHFLIDEGDLIIASSGIKVDYFHKKIAFAKKEDLPLCMNTSTIRFKVLDKKILDINFFKYFLMTHNFSEQVQFHITGSAQLNFGPSHLKQMKIILPPIEIQHNLVLLLDKIGKTKDWRKEADDLTKDLLKSVFLEMFLIDDFPLTKLDKLTSKVSSGSTPLGGSNNYLDDGEILFIRSQNVLMNKFSKHDKLYIPQKIHEQMKRTWVKKLDVLLNITGASIGRTAIYLGQSDKANVNQHVCIIRLKNHNELNPTYLNFYLSSDRIQGYIQKVNAGGTREALNYTQIKDFDIPLPPIELQNKFASIVKEVEAMKEQQKHSKNQIDNIFNALMQKAFKGELKC
jgi:type I restriction enzyme, S subunit